MLGVFASGSLAAVSHLCSAGEVLEGLLDIVRGTLLLYRFKLCRHTIILLWNFSEASQTPLCTFPNGLW